MRRWLRPTLVLTGLLLLAEGMATAEETIWLRGRGDRVWIERDGVPQPPAENAKGFSRVATSSMPGVYAARRPSAAVDAVAATATAPPPSTTVVLGEPEWRRSYFSANSYGYGYYHPRYRTWRYRNYYRDRHYGRHRYYTDRHYAARRYHSNRHYDHGRYRADRHYAERRYHDYGSRGSRYGGSAVNAPARGGYIQRGGAYRRVR
ncbi:MAG: hypothetical protein ACQGVC_10445 [Myxococcota bacterium]